MSNTQSAISTISSTQEPSFLTTSDTLALPGYWAERLSDIPCQLPTEPNNTTESQSSSSKSSPSKVTADIREVISFPRNVKIDRHSYNQFHALQEWEGVVLETSAENFIARIKDLTSTENLEDEEVEFPIEEISEHDKPMLHAGNIFRWSIGYMISGGTKLRVSKIHFRRLPAWTPQDIRSAWTEATTISNSLREHAPLS